MQSPVQPVSWGEGIYNANELPPACPQPKEGVSYIAYHVSGFNKTNEDCLYLNIYKPTVRFDMLFYLQYSIINVYENRENQELYKEMKRMDTKETTIQAYPIYFILPVTLVITKLIHQLERGFQISTHHLLSRAEN